MKGRDHANHQGPAHHDYTVQVLGQNGCTSGNSLPTNAGTLHIETAG
jgi:hypothetical protein